MYEVIICLLYLLVDNHIHILIYYKLNHHENVNINQKIKLTNHIFIYIYNK